MKIEMILDVIAKEYGLNKKMLYIYGDLKGYAVVIKDSLENYATKLYVTFTMQMTTEQKEAIKKVLEDFDREEEKKKFFSSESKGVNLFKVYSIENYWFYDDSIQFKFMATSQKFKERFFEFVDWFVSILEKSKIMKTDHCSICGTEIEKDKDWFLVDYKVYHAHEKCVNYLNEKNEIENETAEKESDGTYLQGIVGAIIGGLLGSLIYIYVGAYIRYLYVFILTTFISIGAVFGYNKLNGKRTRNKRKILLIVTLSIMLIAEMSRVVIIVINEIIKYYGELIPIKHIFETVMYVITEGGEYRFMIMNIVFGSVFVIFGVIGYLKSGVGELNKLKIKKLK